MLADFGGLKSNKTIYICVDLRVLALLSFRLMTLSLTDQDLSDLSATAPSNNDACAYGSTEARECDKQHQKEEQE